MEDDYKERLASIMPEVKRLAAEYYKVAGRPLGVTGEIAEYEAAVKLGLVLADPRTPGYDALRNVSGDKIKIQIKGRCITTRKPGQRTGSFTHEDQWDSAILVLLDEYMEPTEMYEASKDAVIKELGKPGSKARNDRKTLTVNVFKRISVRVWVR